jgi:hypothetical protein
MMYCDGWLLLKSNDAASVFLTVSLEEQVVVHHRGASLGLVRVKAPSFLMMCLDDFSDPLMVAHLNACPFLQIYSPLSQDMIYCRYIPISRDMAHLQHRSGLSISFFIKFSRCLTKSRSSINVYESVPNGQYPKRRGIQRWQRR